MSSPSSHPPYPRSTPGPPPRRRRRWARAALVAGGLLLGCGALVGLGLGLLWAANPMGDEWVCSDGEAPAGKGGVYNACYDQDAPLPEGLAWDPFGNRPMPYNCDKRGWVLIERTVTRTGVADDEQDCVREGTELPGRWRVAEE